MIYFDNSATTGYKPDSVINAAANTLRHISANPGRSGHTMSLKAGLLAAKARSSLASFIGMKNEERLIFTGGCTAALNLAIMGTIQKGGNVVTTMAEHNSVLRPLNAAQKAGLISLTVLRPDSDGIISAAMIEQAICQKTYMVACTHISNVTGAVMPIESIARVCKKAGVLLLVDAAQSVGYGSIEFDRLAIDLMAIAPHKGLHAAQGVGALAVADNVMLAPVMFGGTGTASESLNQPSGFPEGFESGTLPLPAIATIINACDWCRENMLSLNENMRRLSTFIKRELLKIKAVKLYCPAVGFDGIIAFNIGSLSSQDTSNILSEQYDIATRGGLHCAPLMHKFLGTLETGVVRASLGWENTLSHAEHFVRAIREIAGEQ